MSSDPIEVLRELRDRAVRDLRSAQGGAEEQKPRARIAALDAALASLSASKQHTDAIDAAMRDALQHGTGALRVEHIPHGELSAPKPESAEAVELWVCDSCGYHLQDRDSACGCRREFRRVTLYTAPPRPEASDEVAELASRQQPLGRQHDEVLAAHLGEFLDTAPQQASAPVGVEDKARQLLAHEYNVKLGAERAAKVLGGPWTMEEDAALRAIAATLAQQPAAKLYRCTACDDHYRVGTPCDCKAQPGHPSHAPEGQQPAVVDDTARLDFIERTFSGMTNRERYLPVQMIWGKGANGRTLREACDKYRKRDAAIDQARGKGGAGK